MTNIPYALLLLASATAFADSPVTQLQFNAQVEPWQASCPTLTPGVTAACQPPTAISGVAPGTVALDLTLAAAAGQASQTAQEFQLGATGPTAFSGTLTLYSVFPSPDSGFPPYVQVRVDLASPVRATCAESVRLRDPMEIPPIICAAFGNGSPAAGPATQSGVTVTFQAQTSQPARQ